MKQFSLTLLCLLLGLLLTGCSVENLSPLQATGTAIPGVLMPAAEAPDNLDATQPALLYFRFSNEPFLAGENRVVISQPTQSFEYSLISSLLAGPAQQSGILTSLFPEGTRVISTTRQDRLLFVTLSQEITNSLPDEPADWTADSHWRQEIPLRRRLAIQSLVATVTENCEIDSVQILVEQTDNVSESMRLRQSFFREGADNGSLTGPQSRDESLILSPAAAAKRVLTLWQQEDWQSLYLYLADRDPSTGESKRNYADFVTAMTALPVPVRFTCEGGSVSAQGTRATFSIAAELMEADGFLRQTDAAILHLTNEQGLWHIGLSALTGWVN